MPAVVDKQREESGRSRGFGGLGWPDVVGLFVVGGLLGALGNGFVRDQLQMRHSETPLIIDVKTTTTTQTDLCGPVNRDGRPEVISMIYSTDKEEWIEDSANRFAKLCPNVQVKLKGMGEIESANAILSGEEAPTLWAPADELILRYLDTRWRNEKGAGKPIFQMEEQISLVVSPLVGLIWDDRLQVFDAIANARDWRKTGPWVEGMCPLVPTKPSLTGMPIEEMLPGKWIDWYNPTFPSSDEPPVPVPRRRKAEPGEPKYRAPFPSVDQMRAWGRVKFGHTSPTRSASGLEALYLMAYDYVLPPASRTGKPEEDLELFSRTFTEKKDDLFAWLRRCEAGLEPAPESAPLITEAIFNMGPSKYDAVVTYEHLTLAIFDRFDRYASAVSDLRIFYPRPTIINHHPVVFLDLDKNQTDAQRSAAHKWIEYLLRPEVQKRAIEFGFRPANETVSIRDYDSPKNAFLKFRRYGVQFAEPLKEPTRASGELVYELVRIWQDATGRN